jgi:hypothetical protein
MSTNEPHNAILTGPNTTSANELVISIDEFLGNGLDKEEWKNVLEAMGWEHNTNIRIRLSTRSLNITYLKSNGGWQSQTLLKT